MEAAARSALPCARARSTGASRVVCDMEVSHAPSAVGFDPLGNPVPMGEAPGDSSHSYRREGHAPHKANMSGQDLDWLQWFSTQPQDLSATVGGVAGTQRSMRASTGMDSLSRALQNGTPTPVNIATPGSFQSLSQWQLHQVSTAKNMGPAAQGFFRVHRSKRAAANARPRSTEPPSGLGSSGRMRQRLPASRRTPQPRPSWQRNRRSGSLSPLRASRDRVRRPTSRGTKTGADTCSLAVFALYCYLTYLCMFTVTLLGAISFNADDAPPSSTDNQPRRRRLTRSKTMSNLPTGDGDDANSADLSNGLDDEYSKKELIKSEVHELLATGEALLQQYKRLEFVDDAVDEAAREATGSQNHSSFDILVESSFAFQKALALDASNFAARSGMKRAQSLLAIERRKLRKVKCLELFRKRYGDNWREMMALDQDKSDKDLKEVFEMVDEDSSGLLDREEVALVVEFFAGDEEVKDADIDAAMEQMDEDRSGEVDFKEFLDWWKTKSAAASPRKVTIEEPKEVLGAKTRWNRLSRTDSKRRMQRLSSRDDFESNLRHIFNRYDDDGSGEIDATELLEIMQSLGVSVTEQEIDTMVQEIDEDGSGTIDFLEFKTMVQKSMADGSSHGSSRLMEAMVEHSFAAIDDEVKYKWARGTIVRLPNGLYAPVFSEDNLSAAQKEGAQVPSCAQG